MEPIKSCCKSFAELTTFRHCPQCGEKLIRLEVPDKPCAPTHRPAIEVALDMLDPNLRKTMVRRLDAEHYNEQIQTAAGILNVARCDLLCPAKFNNNRQCKNSRRLTEIDPEGWCEKCRTRAKREAAAVKRRKVSSERY